MPSESSSWRHYAADYDNPANQAFVKEWKTAYGTDSTPDFMAVGGWDGMAAIVHVINSSSGRINAATAMKLLEGWKHNSPRGPIMIDPHTRDIVQDEHVEEIVADGDRLRVKVLKTIPAVKDPCKALKIGRCAK